MAGGNPEDFAIVWVLREVGVYFAFSSNVDDALIAQFQESLDYVLSGQD
ncbi:hypothetical protein QWY82_17555 [Simiduia curdlanivorans]|uniref:Uncharacterized protein n=1 Tax=Simiduia curdlanivorans TaxID=1492769 RepID=A0ABV8V4X6_9GAMM|nr:hypothetical protein [Simiduia curdlanivorans]